MSERYEWKKNGNEWCFKGAKFILYIAIYPTYLYFAMSDKNITEVSANIPRTRYATEAGMKRGARAWMERVLRERITKIKTIKHELWNAIPGGVIPGSENDE